MAAAIIPLLPNESSHPINVRLELTEFGTLHNKIINHFIARYLSGKSAIKESCTVTWKRLFLTLSGVQNGDWDSLVLARQVSNYHMAFDYLCGLKNITLNDLHKVNLMIQPNKKTKGVYRTTQNWIGTSLAEAAYIPPAPANVPGLMDNLIEYINDESVDPITKAYVAHSQFVEIHPFRDGNGRVGRLLWSVITSGKAEQSMPVHPLLYRYNKADSKYIQAIRSFGHDNNQGLQHPFWYESIIWGESYKSKFMAHFNQAKNKIHSKIELPIMGKSAALVLQELWLQPVLNPEQVPGKLPISMSDYHSAIAELNRIGILTKRILKTPKGCFVFECSPLTVFYNSITESIFDS